MDRSTYSKFQNNLLHLTAFFCRKFNIGLVTFRDGEPNTSVTLFMKDLLRSSLGTGIILLK